MLYPAQLYAEELKRKLISCWYNPKYQWYFGGEQFAHQVPDNAEYKHEFVHLDSNGNIDGYFSYNHDDAARSLNNFGLISFSEMNTEFIKDVLDRIKYMLFEEGFNRLDFWCFSDNPVRKTYEKIVKYFGGGLAGTLHRSAYFGNNYHNTCFYEILKENIPDKTTKKKDETQRIPTVDNDFYVSEVLVPHAVFGASFHGETWYKCPHCGHSFEFFDMQYNGIRSKYSDKVKFCMGCGKALIL